jgi:hypothetical protein
MSNDEITMAMSIPLDSDGFLRRECPTCEREFKWLASQNDDEDPTPEPDGGIYCPYCSVQAPGDAWHTPAQLEQARAIIMREVVGPQLENLGRSINRLNRSGGMVQASMKADLPDEPESNAEDDAMRQVDFACHPDEPVKVDEGWAKPVHCLICGTPA